MLCLVVALLIFAAMADQLPRTRLGHADSAWPKPRGCGPKASHSAPPRVDWQGGWVSGWRGLELCPSAAAVAYWPLAWQAAFFSGVC